MPEGDEKIEGALEGALFRKAGVASKNYEMRQLWVLRETAVRGERGWAGHHQGMDGQPAEGEDRVGHRGPLHEGTRNPKQTLSAPKAVPS